MIAPATPDLPPSGQKGRRVGPAGQVCSWLPFNVRATTPEHLAEPTHDPLPVCPRRYRVFPVPFLRP